MRPLHELYINHMLSSAAPTSIDGDPGISTSSLFHPSVSSSSTFNPSMAAIIFIVLSTFVFTGMLSVYISRCTSQEQLRRRSTNSNLAVHMAARQHLQSLEICSAADGLDSHLVSRLPKTKFCRCEGAMEALRTGECVVCLSEIEEGEELRWLPTCGHSFHVECIDMWLFSHTTCPLCRRSLLPPLCEGKQTDLPNIGDDVNDSGLL